VNLSDLKRPGTKLADVEPDFRGMPLHQWLKLSMQSQFEAHYRSTAERMAKTGEVPWIETLKISGSRDNYGWRRA
jgi:hypothetical protein